MLRLRAALNARRALGLILIGGGLILFSIYASRSSAPSGPASLRYYGPLVPTPIGQKSSNATGAATVSNKPATIRPASEPTSTADGSALGKSLYTTRQRICVGVPFPETAPGKLEQLDAGWYLDWIQSAQPYQPAGIEYAQMVRAPGGQLLPGLKTIADIAHKNPGALWLIGNEMDVRWQDNATPEQYVTAYHDAYATLKQADPTSRIAIGGITQPSPLRLLYLERVLDAYRQRFGQDMPIDIWNIHNFLLPEKRGSWGVDIPPGIIATSGMTYTIADHGNLELFKQQIVNFRRWMAERGYRDKELLVSEFGILMSTDYGYDYPRVRDFMLNTFEYLRTARDGELGLPADDNRLVQRWCWYSLVDTTYPTGNLADFSSEELTPLGRDFKAYLESH